VSLVEQEPLTLLEHLGLLPWLLVGFVFFCVIFSFLCRSVFVLLVIMLSVLLRFKDSDLHTIL